MIKNWIMAVRGTESTGGGRDLSSKTKPWFAFLGDFYFLAVLNSLFGFLYFLLELPKRMLK